MEYLQIMLVEDNPGDIALTKEALKYARTHNILSIANDGEQALDMLFKKKEYENYTLPNLILLDINLPKINGKEVLAIIKKDERTKYIPVIMLTTSDAETDIYESYMNHANCYIVKGPDMDNLVSVIESIESFWLNRVKLPGRFVA